MKPLSREASAALGAMKATEPSAADEARVRQGLERTLGIAVPTATLAIAAGAQAATGLAALSLGAKTLIVIAAVSATTVVGVVSLASRGTEAPAPQQVKAPEPVLAPRRFEAPPVEPAPAPAPVIPAPPPEVHVARPKPAPVVEAPAAVEEPEPVAAPPPPPPPPEPPTQATAEAEIETNFPGCDADTELRCAQSARQLLNADRAQEAVWLLGSYQRRCPSGRWSDEAWAVRMAGLCKLGRHAEVIGLLQWFSTEYPERRAAVTADLQSSCPAEVLR